MSEITELKHDIATSIFVLPCTEDELYTREFLHNISKYGINIVLDILEKEGALFYKGDKMHIRKSWAKVKLKDRDLF